MASNEDLLVCTACGTQFDIPANQPPKGCRICDDPRQFVPPTGQTWTSLAQMHGKYTNTRTEDDIDARVTSIKTEPKFGIGQRCMLLETAAGNVLWDCITYLDDETIEFIRAKGGLKAIVISHPHYYTTHLLWAEKFQCPVYIAADDVEWLCTPDREGRREFIDGVTKEVIPGVMAVKVGGHFPGSLVLVWRKKLFIADTLVTVPSALYHVDRPPGTTSFAFMWSIPNMIPLSPSDMLTMWNRLKPFEFESTYGAFTGLDVRDKKVKARVLESMKIQARGEGWADTALLKEAWPE